MSSVDVKFAVIWDLAGAPSPQAEHTVYKGFSDVKEKPSRRTEISARTPSRAPT